MANLEIVMDETTVELAVISGAQQSDIVAAVAVETAAREAADTAHAALNTGVHGVGASTVASAADVTTAVTAHNTPATTPTAHGVASGFWAAAAGAASPNATNTLLTNAVLHTVNVKLYGAVGDGVTDDTTAIRNAITAAGVGGSIYFPPGNYFISNYLAPLQNQRLFGAGMRLSSLVSGAGFNNAGDEGELVRIIEASTGVTLEHMGLLGHAAHQYQVLCLADDFTMRFCYTNAQPDRAVQFFLCDRAIMHHCYISGSSFSNTIELTGCNYCDLHDNVIAGSTVNGIEIPEYGDYCVGNRVINNTIQNCTLSGIQIFGDRGSIIVGNTIRDCGGYGIFSTLGEISAKKSLYATIANNTVYSCGADGGDYSGIYIAMAIGHTVSGNICDSNGGNGLVVDSTSTNCIANGNVCINNWQWGMYITCPGTIVRGNICLDNSRMGTNYRDGIRIGADNCIVTENRCTDTRTVGSKTQTYGLVLTGNDTICHSNSLTANSYDNFLDSGLRNGMQVGLHGAAVVSKHLTGTATWNPADIADAAMTSTTVTVTGAAIGDTVSVGFSVAVPAGALLVGAVTATSTVTVTLFNKTGGNLDLGSGTLRADVWKH